jgi:predicted Fe-S protein YdhL (DUF1289 family)
MNRLSFVFLILAFVVGCARGEVTRADWQAMDTKEKDLIIESFRGHEAARDAKGGTGRLHPRSTEHYRERIDELFAAGDDRTVTQIWEDLVEEKSSTVPAPAE